MVMEFLSPDTFSKGSYKNVIYKQSLIVKMRLCYFIFYIFKTANRLALRPLNLEQVKTDQLEVILAEQLATNSQFSILEQN